MKKEKKFDIIDIDNSYRLDFWGKYRMKKIIHKFEVSFFKFGIDNKFQLEVMI